MQRKLTAILCADVHGYSRLMGEDDEATLQTLTSHRRLIDSSIERHRGRFVNSAGDSVLAEFASVIDAVNCAVDIQTSVKAENAQLPPEPRMEFRIGVNLGDVIVEGEQIYGDGVNVAARLESLAEPGGICISGVVHDQLGPRLALNYADLGEQPVKNIAKPVRVLRVLLDGATPPPAKTRQIPRRYWWSGVLSLTGVAIIIGTIVLVQNLSLKPRHTHASIPPPSKPTLALPDKPSIAVLPFINLSGESGQEYFSDGIANQLIDELSRLPGLFVIARNSSFAYKGRPVKEHEIGRELGVKYVLEGSVRKAADRVRIGVELADASTGTEMWTQRYDRPFRDIFAVQDEIVAKVVTTLGLIFRFNQLKIWYGAPLTSNVEAFDDFLRAAEHMEGPSQSGTRAVWTKDEDTKARQWLEKAIELDPKFAEAYAALGWTYYYDAWNQWSANPQADYERSLKEAQKALSLDDSNGDALTLVAWVDMAQGRSDQALAHAERAVATNPNFANGYACLSDLLTSYGRPQGGLAAAEKAIRLDPAAEDSFYGVAAGNALNFLGRYEEGVRYLKRNVAHYPDSLNSHLGLVFAYTELGRDHDARAEAAEVMRISPHFTSASVLGLKGVTWPRNLESDWRKAGLK